MDEHKLYDLLNVIFRNSSVRSLVRQGVSYKEIAELTNAALTSGLLIYSNDKIILSEEGLHQIKVLEKHYKRTNKDEWILPDLKSRVAKIDKNDIFLPRQDELTF